MDPTQQSYPSDLRLLVWKKSWSDFVRQLEKEELTCMTWRVLFSDLLFVEGDSVPNDVMIGFIDRADPDFCLLWNGTTALHDAIEGGVSLSVLEHLVKLCPCTVTASDFEYQSPLDVVCRKIIMKEEQAKYDKGTDEEGELILWEMARLMLVGLTGCPQDEPMLHCLIYAASDCPESLRARGIVKFACGARKRDSAGNMPIHIAAALLPDECDTLDNLERLIQLEPLSVLEPDASNLIPLQIAVKSGRSWSTGISSLTQVAPQSIEILDLAWELYPLLLKNCDENTLYQILNTKPSILKRGGSCRNASL